MDARTRRLERLAAAGDTDAGVALVRSQERSGERLSAQQAGWCDCGAALPRVLCSEPAVQHCSRLCALRARTVTVYAVQTQDGGWIGGLELDVPVSRDAYCCEVESDHSVSIARCSGLDGWVHSGSGRYDGSIDCTADIGEAVYETLEDQLDWERTSAWLREIRDLEAEASVLAEEAEEQRGLAL